MVAAVCEEPDVDWESLAVQSSEWRDRRHAARKAHLDTLVEHGVFEQVPCPAGVRPMTTRWVDKDDFVRARSRLTARGYEQEQTGTEDHYSATPSPASLRLLLVAAEALGLMVGFGDCAQAFLQAPIIEEAPVYVQPPPEAEAGPEVWRLRKTLPGLKGGPAAWGDYATKRMQELFGVNPSAADPCIQSSPRDHVWTLRHMDDYMFVAPTEVLERITTDMGNSLLLRGVVILKNPGDAVQFLGWSVIKRAGGYDLSVNGDLAEAIVADSGLEHSTRKTATPGTREQPADGDKALDPAEHRHYRMQVGRLLFYSALRPDLHFAVGRLARQVAHPTAADAVALKRVARYVKATADYVLELRPKGGLRVTAHSDSDWAGGADRRSVSGGIVFVSGAPVLSWSRVQACRALSSCEAELYGMGSAAVEALFVQTILTEQFGIKIPPTLYGDSSSALALASRRGVGRLKHIETRMLALQDWQRDGRLKLAKVTSESNAADLCTKFLSADRLAGACLLVGLKGAALARRGF